MHVLAYAVAAVLYLAASIRYALRFAQGRRGTTALVAVLVYTGVLSHAAGVALYWASYGEPPLVGLGPSLASLGLLVALALAGLGLFSSARAVGLILAPAASLLLLLALLIGIQPTGSEFAFRGPWLVFHVSVSFIGYAGWLVAAAAALMYLLQFRALKHKHLGAIFEFFPPLETLDRLSEWALVIGFSALTLGIAVGWAWTIRFEQGLRWGDPKVIWGVLAWLALLLALWARFSRWRSTRQAALWNVAGFAVVSVAYLVAKLTIAEARFFL
jgi:ABC-type uncharacterized transport system permease subunit